MEKKDLLPVHQQQLPQLQDSLKDSTHFYIIAHRGAKSKYPENTMPAFKAAVEMGANMVELDIRLSKDGIPVVIHDKSVARTTNSKGFVSDYTLEELKQMDAGSWFSKKFAGVKMPTLEEVLRWGKDKVVLNIELKPLADRAALHGGIEEKCVNLVKNYDMEDQVLFSSFNYKSVAHIDSLNPEIPIAILYNWRASGKLLPTELVARYHADAFHCSKDALNKRWIQNLKSQDIPFLIYTVNRKRAMKRLYKQGAKGIFTDHPGRLKKVYDEIKGS